jgi:hypothetical protein
MDPEQIITAVRTRRRPMMSAATRVDTRTARERSLRRLERGFYAVATVSTCVT